MRNELISVIVPVYNVEKYLCKCVDSILAQTYTNLEIILVDDGSPDNCPAICDEYAEKDSRIKVIHKENGGLSSARNAGTEIALGEYITYIDSDDYVDEMFIEVLVNGLNVDTGGKKAGIVCEQNAHEEEIEKAVGKEISYSVFSPDKALAELCLCQKYGASACAKLFSREIALMYPFPLRKIYEDLATTYKMVSDSECVIYCNALHYHYVRRDGSICHQKWNNSVYDLMEAADNLLNFIDENYPEIHCYGVYRYFFAANEFINRAHFSPDFKEIILPIRKKLKKLLPDLKKNKRLYRIDYIKFLLEVYAPELEQKIRRIIKKNGA